MRRTPSASRPCGPASKLAELLECAASPRFGAQRQLPQAEPPALSMALSPPQILTVAGFDPGVRGWRTAQAGRASTPCAPTSVVPPDLRRARDSPPWLQTARPQAWPSRPLIQRSLRLTARQSGKTGSRCRRPGPPRIQWTRRFARFPHPPLPSPPGWWRLRRGRSYRPHP